MKASLTKGDNFMVDDFLHMHHEIRNRQTHDLFDRLL
jgi:hypothetical protein